MVDDVCSCEEESVFCEGCEVDGVTLIKPFVKLSERRGSCCCDRISSYRFMLKGGRWFSCWMAGFICRTASFIFLALLFGMMQTVG